MEKEVREEFPKFNSPEEEIAFLRRKVEEKEGGVESQAKEIPQDSSISQEINEYKEKRSEDVLTPEFNIETSKEGTSGVSLDLSPEKHDEKIAEFLGLLEEKGIKNTLKIIGEMGNPHLEDDFHRFLVQYLKEGFPIKELKENGPLWNALHMTLYEITLPQAREENTQKPLRELLSSIEQLYAGILTHNKEDEGSRDAFTFEIALPDKSDHIIFYTALPKSKKDLFEKQLFSIFPSAHIKEQKDDYNVFVEEGVSLGSSLELSKNHIFPIQTYENFEHDPINFILNVFSKIEKEGGGAAIQFVFKPEMLGMSKKYENVVSRLEKGESLKDALASTGTAITEELGKTLKFLVFGGSSSKKEGEAPQLDQTAIEVIKKKIARPLAQANIRIVASGTSGEQARDILSHLESSFNQFANPQGNKFTFKRLAGGNLTTFFKEFSFRDFKEKTALTLNFQELATIIHFPTSGIATSPQFKQAKAGGGAAPLAMGQKGTLLGINSYRNQETNVYLSKEDRLRHLYVIGQTGTGKTTLLKNMIAQDIEQGEGVCMIDPHGSDITDVLSSIPENRFDDVIYFDPGYTERVMGLNMLEYDRNSPEQKTFVVNELFSIFQKLYSGSPESMGPMFEQYFRNATMLVLEDPESGATLGDVSRILADENYRNMKLSRCNNPVVKQFWTEVAGKAGGEAALANMVPYITSKFDVFMANDIMRPIISQQKSTFNFREIMDEKKILLVNLSKGRIGDINSNLIGLIIVGKILMAALSRVDDVEKKAPPFYLYIDEFQNVTTDSISVILSEARKYKLSLTVAHQFIAQINESIRDAIFGNVGSLASFRIGADDATFLEKQFEPVFSAQDLMNIDNRNAVVRMLVDGRPEKPFSIQTVAPPQGNPNQVETLKELSYSKYGRPRAEIEEEIKKAYGSDTPKPPVSNADF